MRKLMAASSFLAWLMTGTSTALSEPVGLPELKKAIAYMISDMEKLKAENRKIQKELEELRKENLLLKEQLSHLSKYGAPQLPEIFSESVLSPYILYVGTYRSFRGAVLKASQVLNKGETPLVISLKDNDLFAVAIECSSLKDCKEKKQKLKGFISFKEKRGKSAVFNIRKLFNEAKAKLTGDKTSALVKGFPFYRIKTDPRMVRPYPHLKDGNSFIVMKLEGTL